MSTITVGSGLGGFTAIAAQPTYGAGSELTGTSLKAGSPGGAFVTPTRPIYGLKSNKATHDPHIVQGTDYLEYGRIVDIGAAHVQTYIDAHGTMAFDPMSSGFALLMATAFGSQEQLIQSGTSGAWELGGPTGIVVGPPERNNANTWNASTTYPSAGSQGEIVLEGGSFYKNIAAGTQVNLNQKPSSSALYWTVLPAWKGGTVAYLVGEQVVVTPPGGNGKAVAYQCIKNSTANEPETSPEYWQVIGSQSGSQFDMQLGVPTAQAEVTPWNYHSCMIDKFELVFERTGLVSCTIDWDAQYVENSTGLIVPSTSVTAEPFSMGNSASVFKVGAPGKQTTLGGVKKMTVTLQRKMANARVYLGNTYKEIPSTNGMVDLMVSCEMDYTSQAKSLLETFLKNQAQALTCTAVGAPIGTSAKSNELSIEMSNGFIQTGGEAPLDGPDVVKNTVVLKATINGTNASPLTGKLTTSDNQF